MEKSESIEVELSDEEFLYIAKAAHERDITFNQMVNLILGEHFNRMSTEQAD